MRGKRWGVADLARALDLDHSTISKILAGKRSAGIAVASAIEGITAGMEGGPIRVRDWLHAGASVQALSARDNWRGRVQTP